MAAVVLADGVADVVEGEPDAVVAIVGGVIVVEIAAGGVEDEHAVAGAVLDVVVVDDTGSGTGQSELSG